MSKLKELIDRIIEFGTNEKLESENKTLEIQRLLIDLYAEYLTIETEFDETEYENPSYLDHDAISAVLAENLPDFGWYHSVFESHKIDKDAELVTEDSIDDLADIIKDLVEVQWRMENNSEKDGLYHFEFLMKHHSEQHLVNLLKYLKDKNE